MKMTLESFEWDVILHLERQLKKLRQKEGKNAIPSFFSANALKGLQMTSWQKWVSLVFQTLFIIWERDEKEKETEKSDKLCLFEGKMLSISSAVRMYCMCQLDVDTFVFFTRSFTERGVWRTFLGKILLESESGDITIPHIVPGKSRLFLVMKGEREACSVNRELEPRFSGCHPDVSQYKWAHLISPVNFILESSQWA